MGAGKCHRCGDPLAFVLMAGAERKVRPVDPIPDELGRVIAQRVGSRLIRGRVSPVGERVAGVVRLRDHHETCSGIPPRKTPKPPPDLAEPLPTL